MVKNQYKVSKSQWKKWSDAARDVFNKLYFVMTTSPWIFQHPALGKMTKTSPAWKTTAWNASWMAADAVDGKI